MSHSNWRTHIAARGFVIAAFVVIVAGCGFAELAHAQGRDYEYSETYQQDPNSSADIPMLEAPATEHTQDHPTPYDPRDPCERPKSNDESDLCQQWRMAEAAKEMLTYTDRQNNITIVEAALLFLSLILGAYASIQATVAARTADKTAKTQLRAYVEIASMAIRYVELGKRPHASGGIKNTGQTPARNVRTAFVVGLRDFPNPQPMELPVIEGTPSNVSIGTQETVHFDMPLKAPLDKEEMERIEGKTLAIFLWGHVEYEDVFGRKHHSRACVFIGGDGGIRPDGSCLVYHEGNTAG